MTMTCGCVCPSVSQSISQCTCVCSWSWLGNDSYPGELQQRLEDHGVQLFYNLFEIAPAALKLFRFNMTDDGRVLDDGVRCLSVCLSVC